MTMTSSSRTSTCRGLVVVGSADMLNYSPQWAAWLKWVRVRRADMTEADLAASESAHRARLQPQVSA